MTFPSDRRSTIIYLLALAFALAFVLFDSSWRLTQVQRATKFAQAAASSDTPLTTPNVHERHIILPAASMDARWWVILTEQMQAAGDWRIRSTQQDNAPVGREVHWSSLPMWILSGIGSIITHLRPNQTADIIPQAALYFGPVTFAFALIALSFLVWRVYGGRVSAVFCLAMVGALPLYLFFRAGEADHHGLVSICSLASVLFLVMGGLGLSARQKNEGKPKRRTKKGSDEVALEEVATKKSPRSWFISSGVAGAAGIWISAASQIPVLVGCGLVALLVALLAGRSRNMTLSPKMWRIWGISGALACMGFYLLEYFPSHLGLRMEVNNPIYAVAWLGAGHLLEASTRLLSRQGSLAKGGIEWVQLAASLMAVAAPAVVILAAKEQLFWVSDRFVFDLHRFYIREFQGIAEYLKGDNGASFGLNFLLPAALCLVVAFALLWKGRVPEQRRYELLFALGPAVVLQILSISQVRWTGNAAALWAVTIVVIAVIILESTALRRSWKIGALALFLLAVGAHPTQSVLAAIGTTQNEGTVEREFLPAILTHDIAMRINRSHPQGQPRILSGPTSSTELAYYGGDAVVGTLYWENRPGLEAAADIYAATNEAEFKELLQKRGITHLVLFSWDSFAQSYVRLHRGLGKSAEARDGCLASYLEGTRPQPIWLRPLYYPIPKSYGLKDAWVRIYQVVPDQTPAQWHLHVGMYQVDAGRLDLAEKSFRESLKLDPTSVETRVALATVLIEDNKSSDAVATMNALITSATPQRPDLIESLASEMARIGKNEAAILLYSELVPYYDAKHDSVSADRCRAAIQKN